MTIKQYNAEFFGRTKNALGITYKINTVVKGKDEKEAELNLYNTYEHISGLELNEITE